MPGLDQQGERQGTPLLVARRTVLATVGTGLPTFLGGCAWTAATDDADIVAGADGRMVFEPRTITISPGDTVTWGFATGGHNVCCDPADHDEATIPSDATAFASYGANDDPSATFVPRGGTYEHRFYTPGEYHYVCIPHADRGMTGTIIVD